MVRREGTHGHEFEACSCNKNIFFKQIIIIIIIILFPENNKSLCLLVFPKDILIANFFFLENLVMKWFVSQLVSQLIHVQLLSLDFGPQGAINKIYNLLHHVLG